MTSTFRKESILIKQLHQKSVVLLDKWFKFQPDFCNGCHDVNDVFKRWQYFKHLRCYYCCIINKISKSEAVNLLQNADLKEERRVL